MSETSQTGVLPPQSVFTQAGAGGTSFGFGVPAHSVVPSPSMSAHHGVGRSEQSSSVSQPWLTLAQNCELG
jgi:hypothetical protein